MSLKTPIVIDNFQKGMSSSAHTSDGAFATGQGIDVTSELGVIKVSHILTNLLRFKEVDFIEHAREKASELVGYILLRRTRFFFIVED